MSHGRAKVWKKHDVVSAVAPDFANVCELVPLAVAVLGVPGLAKVCEIVVLVAGFVEGKFVAVPSVPGVVVVVVVSVIVLHEEPLLVNFLPLSG